jgi:hypothetical protein
MGVVISIQAAHFYCLESLPAKNGFESILCIVDFWSSIFGIDPILNWAPTLIKRHFGRRENSNCD